MSRVTLGSETLGLRAKDVVANGGLGANDGPPWRVGLLGESMTTLPTLPPQRYTRFVFPSRVSSLLCRGTTNSVTPGGVRLS